MEQIGVRNIERRLSSGIVERKKSYEEEAKGCFNFLDFKLMRRPNRTMKGFIHRKVTWSDQYLHFVNSTPTAYKRDLVKTLYPRARSICTPDALAEEVSFLRGILIRNGYPAKF